MAEERGSAMDMIAYFLNGSRWVWVTIAVVGAVAIAVRVLGL
jgi:ABC-type phosphate transport system auxiliary subunit